MRAIGRFACELLGVLAAGFVGFFVMLAYMAGFLIWFACGLACVGFLLVALFSMVMWLSTHDAHAFRTMLGYFVYAAGAFAVIAMLSYYKGKLMDGVKIRWERRTIFGGRGWSGLAADARFEA
jgi:hypothetical protein